VKQESTSSLAARSFAVQVFIRRGAPLSDTLRFEQRVLEWCADHGYLLEGAQTSFSVTAERELCALDQVDLLLALLDEPLVRLARLGPIKSDSGDPTDEMGPRPWAEADASDPLVAAARELYEAGRLGGVGFSPMRAATRW